eukprot:16433901-Heterocapsa_arctica.AAC.2
MNPAARDSIRLAPRSLYGIIACIRIWHMLCYDHPLTCQRPAPPASPARPAVASPTLTRKYPASPRAAPRHTPVCIHDTHHYTSTCLPMCVATPAELSMVDHEPYANTQDLNLLTVTNSHARTSPGPGIVEPGGALHVVAVACIGRSGARSVPSLTAVAMATTIPLRVNLPRHVYPILGCLTSPLQYE